MEIAITNGEHKCEFINVSKESVEKIYAILIAEYNNPDHTNYSTTAHPMESNYEKYKDYCYNCRYRKGKEFCNECKQSHYYEIPSKYSKDLDLE